MTYRQLLLLFISFTTFAANGQQKTSFGFDSTSVSNLPDITVLGRNSQSDYHSMPDIVGTNIYAGKKSVLVVMDNVQGNVVNNTMRQVLAKVPGIHIWESDPSGIQVGIAARGLSANRSWEFNIRQNGYDISADPYGYPEAYYNPPMQAVQRIEVVRGQGSLQYGPQFGGLVNYILRNGSGINKPLQIESQQTVGSNGLFNSYNAMGGKRGKVQYYAFFDHRNGNGWRQNSRYYTNTGYATLTWQMKPSVSISFELMHSHIRSQQPGGLTDSMFLKDPQQSLRTRNWFDITWTNPAIIASVQLNSRTRWNSKLFATIGNRNSVGFLQAITVADSINAQTLQYNPRTVNIDQYRNLGFESRILTSYRLGKQQQYFSAGVRFYTGSTYRRTDGKGTTGTGYDLTVAGNYPKDIHFTGGNIAAFAEQIFSIGEKWQIIPGIRYEWIAGTADGRNGYQANGEEILLQQVSRKRSFVLAGLAATYRTGKTNEWYANVAQAYRPIQFANLQAPPGTDVIDPDLRDARGYNADLGFRGNYKSILRYDASLFYLQYNDRIGTITPDSANYRLVTNVGASSSKGVEAYIEFNAARLVAGWKHTDVLLFASYSYTDAQYSNNHKVASTKGKKVENAPNHILRTGLTVGYKSWMITAQVSYSSAAYSDANNTKHPSANGQTGLIPAYTIADLSGSWSISEQVTLKAGINNIANEYYFTRRAGGYPGPGVLPADGRTGFVTLGLKW